MKFTLDRIENRRAVLVSRDNPGDRITIPAILLPAGCQEGDILTVTIDRDIMATLRAKERISGLTRRLKKGS